MNALHSYRDKIRTIVAAIDTDNSDTFTMKSATNEFDDVRQVSVKLFPRAYVFTPHGVPMPSEVLDISNFYQATAQVQVDCWRYLDPATAIQQTCDNTADDIISNVLSDAYWTTNNTVVSCELGSVTYRYFADRIIKVEVVFDLAFFYDKT